MSENNHTSQWTKVSIMYELYYWKKMLSKYISLMRILIIDNHTSHRDELAELLSDHEVSFIDVAEMDYRNVDADAIVLTGSHEAPFYSDRYNTELEFLRETELPVI